jgi:hypothetical protein
MPTADATSTQPQWLFGLVLSARKNSCVSVVGISEMEATTDLSQISAEFSTVFS